MEIDERRAWTLVIRHIKGLSKRMQIVESRSVLNNIAWCRRHNFVVTSNDQVGLHWFVCGMDCCVCTLELHGFDPPFLSGAQAAWLYD